MEKDQMGLVKYRSRYLKLIYEITKYKMLGEQPPKELLQQAREVALQASIPKDEFENISYVCCCQ
jgi:hypothetical protein